MVRDCVVRASRLALTALYTFALVYVRFTVYDRYRALGAYLYARVRNAVAALIGNVIFVVGAFVARRRNYLHKGRFVILIRDITLIHTRRYMYGFIRRAQ